LLFIPKIVLLCKNDYAKKKSLRAIDCRASTVFIPNLREMSRTTIQRGKVAEKSIISREIYVHKPAILSLLDETAAHILNEKLSKHFSILNLNYNMAFGLNYTLAKPYSFQKSVV